MTRIANAEHVLLLLRAQLQRSGRRRRAPDAGAKKRDEANRGAVARLSEIARAGEVSDAALARALIAGLLADEFGENLSTEPGFQQTVEDVRRIIEGDETSSTLLREACERLKRR